MTEVEGRRRRFPVVGLLLLAVAVGLGGWLLVSGRDDASSRPPRFERVTSVDGPVEHDYVIVPGTAARLARGEPVEVVPRIIEAEVGDVIRIRNDDSDAAFVGPFFVPAGEEVAQRAVSAGVMEGECTTHPEGKLTFVVTG
jgi:hypothetical protein